MRYELVGMAFLLVSYMAFGVQYSVKSTVIRQILRGIGYLTMVGVFGFLFLSFL